MIELQPWAETTGVMLASIAFLSVVLAQFSMVKRTIAIAMGIFTLSIICLMIVSVVGNV